MHCFLAFPRITNKTHPTRYTGAFSTGGSWPSRAEAGLELCADVTGQAAARRSILVDSSAALASKEFFYKIPEKIIKNRRRLQIVGGCAERRTALGGWRAPEVDQRHF